MTKPRFYRATKDHAIGWEIYSWSSFFITISFFKCEIQINKWRG